MRRSFFILILTYKGSNILYPAELSKITMIYRITFYYPREEFEPLVYLDYE